VLGRSDSGTARLEEATIAYRAALEVLTRENHAAQWAAIQGGLGLALFMLGERESGTVRFEHAVVAHRAALEEQTRERDPVQWAMTQASLGNALHMLGTRDNDTIRLEEAVIAFRDALHELTRERAPTQWAEIVTSLAQTEESLGFAYFHRGDFVAAARHLREGGDRNAYSFLWLYLASSRIGEPNTKENLQENATRLNLLEWPYPVIELFLGQRTPVDMVAAATSQDEICESQFYLGQWYLLRDERAASIEALRKVIDDTCSRDLIEFAGAATELKRLGQ
jgi:tetratricopeptide (TPR) repeat protein